MRTALALASFGRILDGIKHTALEDAKAQAVAVSEAWAILRRARHEVA